MESMRAQMIALLVLFLSAPCISLSPPSGAAATDSDSGYCRDNERNALLKFKQGITSDPSGRLSSWAGLDCCKWAGVRCDNRTGHVTQLRLQNSSPYDEKEEIHGNISPSLVELKHLRHLDLSGNYFSGTSIPEFFSFFSRLRYLNLSYCEFQGKIPPQLGNLTNLRYLDLHCRFTGCSPDTPMDWLSRLSSLKYLDLSGTNLSKSFDAESKLPALSVLILLDCSLNSIPYVNFSALSYMDLSENHLSSIPSWNFVIKSLSYIDLSSNLLRSIPNWVFGVKSLSYMDLSRNDLSSVPNWVFGIKSLQVIDLSFNILSGSISGFGNLSSLQMLRLQSNNFNHTIPKAIGDLCHLQVFDLRENGIEADITEILESLSGCAMNSLQTLNLRANLISGKLPDWLGNFTKLSELRLEENSVSGSIPASLGGLSSMTYLALAHNRLEGLLPNSLWRLSKLVVLHLSFNSLEGTICDAHLSNLTKLKVLSLSSNSIVLNLSSNWIPPFQLKHILLASCVVGPQFPSWLKTQSMLRSLDISDGNISDSMPDWFWNLPVWTDYLNLSYNHINGSIPLSNPLSEILTIDLRSNQFHGPLPRMDGTVGELFLSNNFFSGDLHPVLNNKQLGLTSLLLSDNLITGAIPQSICELGELEVLDLSSNLLTGEFPNCSTVLGHFSAINFANNNLSGHIPQWIGSLTFLESLHLSNNNLYGEIPSLQNCTNLLVLDLGENKLEGNIPIWIGESLLSMKMLRLRSNRLNGVIPHQLSLLRDLQVLDLAKNNLTGVIPPCLGNLSAMTSIKHTLFDFHPLQKSSMLIPDFDKDSYVLYRESMTELKWTLMISMPDFNIDFSAIYTESMLLGLKGMLMKYSNILSLVVNLDLSGNAFLGEIPKELMKLVGLQSLNLSGNQLTGSIPQEISYLQLLETLDLSMNQLSGVIPASISSLTFLSHLNLSHNDLSGRIPTGNQLQTLDPSVYTGNNGLCGNPLPSKCPGDKPSPLPVPNTRKGRESETIWMYIGGIIGFAVGCWTIWGALLLKKSWRVSYFKLIDNIHFRLCRS